MPQTNHRLSERFAEMASVLEVLGGDIFRIRAFQKAARMLGHLEEDLATTGPDPKALMRLEGIGKSLADRISEFLRTGQIQEHQALVAQVPPGLAGLLRVPGLGPKTVAMLWKEAGIQSTAQLLEHLEKNTLPPLPGLGEKKLENLRKALSFTETTAQRWRLDAAMAAAVQFLAMLRAMPQVLRAAYAGSLRRGCETIGDLDLLVAADPQQPDHARQIGEAFVTAAPIRDILGQGPTKCSVRTFEGLQIDLRIISPASFGAAWLYFTGSKEHNILLRARAGQRGMKLSEYGLFEGETLKASETEEAIYQALGLDWVPPELREDHGELALAERHALPGPLVTVADIHAELHAHTTASDGKLSIRELAEAAIARGFHTLAVTDHSKSQTLANGLDADRLLRHIAEVRKVAAEVKDRLNLLAGAEVDILADGRLDYADEVLAELDLVVASPHAALTQDDDKATHRLLRAIENPYVTILGHPTGRLVGRRAGLSPDMPRVIAAARARGIAMEINANAARLDLRDTHARLAIEAGVMLAINCDTHSRADLDELPYGVLTARRAGVTPSQVVNCLSREALATWLAGTRRGTTGITGVKGSKASASKATTKQTTPEPGLFT